MLRRGVWCLVVGVVVVSPLQAQGLRDQISQLFTFGNCGKPLCLDPSIVGGIHGNHFLNAAAGGNLAIISFITDAVAANASNFPISATSGGATFKFEGGFPVKTSESSGPVFGERAQTLGRKRFLFGANLTGIRFKTLRGEPIDNLTFNFTHEDVPGTPGYGNPSFENDLIQVRMSLYVNLQVYSLFMTYGLLDKVDLSVAVPLVHTSIEGRSVAQILPFGPPPVLHFFGGTSSNPVLRAAVATFGSSTGLGDVATRLKVNLSNNDHLSAALLADVRLPTGKEQDLLGSGEFSARGLAIFSSKFGSFSPHLNVGYLYTKSSLQNDAFLATAGFDQLMSDWATFAGDVISSWEVGPTKLTLPGPVTYDTPYVRTVYPTTIPNQRDNNISASIGMKLKTGKSGTVVGNALIPLLKGALEPNIVWTAGMEFNF
jgi:hypothetical protein